MSTIVLPRLLRLELRGFDPLFDEPLILDLPAGPFLILGGNGLGKTTILQSAIYAIAGPADEQVEEEDKSKRWDRRYFSERLNETAEAEVIITFQLGTTTIAVRRDFRNNQIRSLSVDNGPWINDTSTASERYEEVIRDIGGYGTHADFNYLVHRLCYLPEHRTSLLWDQHAQIRTIMLICSDSSHENRFRSLSKELKLTHSEMRHCHVDIGHLESRIDRIEKSRASAKRRQPPEKKAESTANIEKTAALQKKILEIINKRLNLTRKLNEAQKDLRILNSRLEEEELSLNNAEHQFVLGTLQNIESGNEVLALHKLLVHHLCPYCTQSTDSLAQKAKDNLEHGDCPICGQQNTTTIDPSIIATLRADLVSKTQRRDALEQSITAIELEHFQVQQQELELRTQLDASVEKLPRVPKDEAVEFATDDLPSLNRTLNRYKIQYERLKGRVEELGSLRDADFHAFTLGRSTRLQELQRLASNYGMQFLGDPCEFVPVPVSGQDRALTYFVPRFADKNRLRPETCSESERFFLDIAFRMAAIDLACSLSKTEATFICETPENALDLAYTENVADLFTSFARKDRSLFLTANIQAGGVALPILSRYPKRERPKRMLDLITRGSLTRVQSRNRDKFQIELQKINDEEYRNGSK